MGAGSPSVSVGGDQHPATVRATRSRSNNAHRQGGMGTAAGGVSTISTVVFRSWPSFDGYFLLNEGWLDGAGEAPSTNC